MKNTRVNGIRLATLCSVALLCTGCPNPNTYGTPRTTPVGKIQHSVAVEAFGFSATEKSTNSSISGTVPTFPTYTLRIGVADTVDIGARLSNFSSLGADVKWNFIKSESFDMAFDPGFQVFHIGGTSGGVDSSYSQLYLNGALLFGINVGDSVSIVPSLGATYGWSSASIVSDSDREAAASGGGVMARFGVGFDFRVSQRFAIHPEITFLKSLSGADTLSSSLLYMAGVGFNFGNLPKYGAEAAEPAK
jgi:hypothetical protein